MASYQKFTLQTIKDNLASGKYKNLTGANRAIGKTQDLSNAEKEKAKALAAKHFGVDPEASRAKPAKRRVAKAAGRPAAKRKVKARAKRAAKKTRAPKAVAKAAPVKAPAKRRGRKPRAAAESAPARPAAEAKVRVRRARAAVESAPPASKASNLEQAGSVISTLSQAITSMEQAKRLYPKADVGPAVEAASKGITQAVRNIQQEVAPDSKAEQSRGKRAPKVSAAPPAAVAEPEAPIAEDTSEPEDDSVETDDESLEDEGTGGSEMPAQAAH